MGINKYSRRLGLFIAMIPRAEFPKYMHLGDDCPVSNMANAMHPQDGGQFNLQLLIKQ
jgi:hypothetical protein